MNLLQNKFISANDGQHLYLHAMNVKMLEMQYGRLENSPHVITGKLLEKEGGSLTEDLRRRLRYLCHLPLTSQFEVAEIELKPPIVSEEVLSSFHGDSLSPLKKCQSIFYWNFKRHRNYFMQIKLRWGTNAGNNKNARKEKGRKRSPKKKTNEWENIQCLWCT